MLATSTNVVLALVLAIVGGLLGAIDVIRSKGQSLTSWGVVAVAGAVIFLTVKALG